MNTPPIASAAYAELLRARRSGLPVVRGGMTHTMTEVGGGGAGAIEGLLWLAGAGIIGLMTGGIVGAFKGKPLTWLAVSALGAGSFYAGRSTTQIAFKDAKTQTLVRDQLGSGAMKVGPAMVAAGISGAIASAIRGRKT